MARRDDIPSLTGARGVAACSVLFGHALDASFYYQPTLHPFAARFAYFGMSLFFVLSGFVIHYNYADLFRSEPLKTAISRFFVARFARLYPLYAVAILCSIPLIPVPFPGWIMISYLTMTQSWFNVEYAIFPPTWSISTEWFFYVAFIPLTMVVVRLGKPVAVFVALSIAAIGGLSLAFGLWRIPITAFTADWFWHGNKVSGDPWEWSNYLAPYLRVLDFVSGMLMAQAYRMRAGQLPSVILPAGLLWICIVGLASLTPWAPLENLVPNFLYVLAIAPMMLHVCVRKSWLSRALSSPGMLFLGEISYSIYIWSFFVIIMLGNMFTGAIPITLHYFASALRVVAICGLTIVVAYGSYTFIEAPARRFIRRQR